MESHVYLVEPLFRLAMVGVYCHQHVTDEGQDCHLGSEHHPAPHQKELYYRILQNARDGLPDKYQVKQTSGSGFKVVNQEGKQEVYVNYYESDTGYRVKLNPWNSEFFEDVFRPLVEEVPVPDEVDTCFKWEAFLLEENTDQSCSICGKAVEGGNPILAIKSPYDVQAGDIVEEKVNVDRVNFRACFECAGEENRKSMVERELTFVDERMDFFAHSNWLNEL